MGFEKIAQQICDSLDNMQGADAKRLLRVLKDITSEIYKESRDGMMDATYGLETALLIIKEKIEEYVGDADT